MLSLSTLRRAALALLCSVAAYAAPPLRIVSTAPSITEALYALGLGSNVVGDTLYCTYPNDARSKPKIGTFLQPDYERILALRPTLVLVLKNPVGVTQKLRGFGLHAEDVNQDSIEDTLASFVQIGKLTGRDGAALANRVRAELDAVRNAAAKLPRKRTLFLVGRSQGTLQGMVGTGSGTFIDELLQLTGATNVLGGLPVQYPALSLEQVLTRDPEVILDMGDFAHAEGRPGQPEPQVQALWAAYPQLRAVKTHRVHVVASDTLVRPGPRMGEAARIMLKLVHPEAQPVAAPRPR